MPSLSLMTAAKMGKFQPAIIESQTFSGQDIHGVGALVHQIQLCAHPDGAIPLGIHFLRNLERVRIGNVHVRGGHCQDDAVGVLDELHHKLSDLRLDVLGLAFNGHLHIM